MQLHSSAKLDTRHEYDRRPTRFGNEHLDFPHMDDLGWHDVKPVLHLGHPDPGMYLDTVRHVYRSMIWNGGFVEDPGGRGKGFRMSPDVLSLVLKKREVVWFQIFHKQVTEHFQEVSDGE